MSVIFESCIKVDENGEWFIELLDTLSQKVATCQTMDEYAQKVEEFGAVYGGQIDEVKWSKDDNVSPHAMDEIRLEMSKQQQELEKQKEESL
ncbi:MAG: hypothetical protein NTZ60_05895 [Campylobacterales bacterium]|nr:hypothetical protein [Campylobacterales bacterium]